MIINRFRASAQPLRQGTTGGHTMILTSAAGIEEFFTGTDEELSERASGSAAGDQTTSALSD